MASKIRYCPDCNNYLYLSEDMTGQTLNRVCRSCGYQEADTQGGLIMETDLQEKSSEGYKPLLNEFTLKDPTLPHLKNVISCPNADCISRAGGAGAGAGGRTNDITSDIVYLKYDRDNMKYVYICVYCKTTWKSKEH